MTKEAEKVAVVVGATDPGLVAAVVALLAKDENFAVLVAGRVGEQVPTLLDDHFKDVVAVAQFEALIGQRLDEALPDRIEALTRHVPTEEQLSSFVAAQLAKSLAPKPDPAVEAAAERAERARKADSDRVKAARKAAEKLAEERAGKREKALEAHEVMTADLAPVSIDLETVSHAALLLSDGKTFSIDFSRAVDVADLSIDDAGSIRLKHPDFLLGENAPEVERVSHIALTLDIGEAPGLALFCPLVQPMLIGGGHVAKISENSLIFRRRL